MPEKLLEALGSIGLETKGQSLSWVEFFWKNFPADAQQLYGFTDKTGIAMLDAFKFNHQPTSLDPTDLVIPSWSPEVA